MKSNARAAVAAVALSHSRGSKVSSIYSYGGEGYVNIDVSVIGNRAQGYDYTNGCHVSGNLPSLYHYGQNAHIELKPSGEGRYSGYDYGSCCHFEISVRGNSADVYDYGASSYFSYSL
jgi:hypothetical protein